MELKIEKGVPLPGNYGQSKGSAAAFRAMEDGDSILFAERDAAHKFSMSARFERDPEYKVAMRKVEGGYRVWKVKRDPKPNGSTP